MAEDKYTKHTLTGDTPFHRPRKFSVRMTLTNTVIIPTFGALRDRRVPGQKHTHTNKDKPELDAMSG